MPLLIVSCEETSLSRRFLIREDRFTVGRSRSSTVAIRDSSVSKVHLVIQRTGEGYTFQDLWSRNGTFLNDVKREAGPLRDGDVIRLGRVRIAFHEDAVGPAALPPALAAASRKPAVPGERPARAERRPRRIRGGILLASIGILGVTAGLTAGKLSSVFGRREAEPPAGEARAHPGDRSGLAEVREAKAEAESGENAASPAGPTQASPAEPRETEEWLAGLEKPYRDADESHLVLFRLSLDLLGRPPTRAEAREWLPLGHRERWKRIEKLARAAPLEVGQAFRRMLDRPPAPEERSSVEAAIARLAAAAAGAKPEDTERDRAGLLLSASSEYRDSGRRRRRTPAQRARSLVVDLLDRLPSDEEAVDVERALEDFPRGGAVARSIGYAEGSTGVLPDLASPRRSAEAREWAADEARRFLLHPPEGAIVEALSSELSRGPEGARWVRLALAQSEGYRSY